MRCYRCLECESDDVYFSTIIFHYYCNSCGWWIYADVYDKMIREISQIALEEVLGEP